MFSLPRRGKIFNRNNLVALTYCKHDKYYRSDSHGGVERAAESDAIMNETQE